MKVIAAFVLGAAAARVLAGGSSLTAASFEGKAAKEAAAAILTVAEAQAANGTWEPGLLTECPLLISEAAGEKRPPHVV